MSQNDVTKETAGTRHAPIRLGTPVSDRYREPLLVGLLIQAILLLLTALLLDGGLSFQITLMASLAFWGGAVLILFRRPRNPTRLDLWVMKWGSLVLIPVALVIVPLVWRWMGRL